MKNIFIAVCFVLCSFPAFAQNNKLETATEKVQDNTQLSVPKVVVTDKRLTNQFETVGEYNQPIWTTTRMFPSTRAYVMTPPGNVKYEKWFDFRDRKDGPTMIRMRDELAFGLGNRLELDLYHHTVYDGAANNQTFSTRGFSWEIRYALADWGKIWGNPTLYFEHKMINGRQGIEPKLLLSDRIGNTDWIWATNFIYEANLSGETPAEQKKEYAVTASVGKVFNENWMLGLSSHVRKYDYDTNLTEVYLGPAVNYKINNSARISAEVMPKISDDGYYDSRSFLIFAYDFK